MMSYLRQPVKSGLIDGDGTVGARFSGALGEDGLRQLLDELAAGA